MIQSNDFRKQAVNIIAKSIYDRNKDKDKTPYQQNLSVPVQQPAQEINTRNMLGNIYSMKDSDPQQAANLMGQFQYLQNDPSSQFFNPYTKPTNKAVGYLAEYGIDASGINDDWFQQNSWYRQYLKTNTNTNTIATPGKKATADEKAAYQIYQLEQAEGQTKQAEQEWDALQQELTYWAQRTDRNYSDDEIIKNINWSNYKTLKKMDEDRLKGTPMELNRAIGYSEDALYGVLWKARNPDQDVDLYQAMANSALGSGNVWKNNQEIADRLDPNSEKFNPYALGSTNLDDAAVYFNVPFFGKEWLQQNDGLQWSDDETQKKMYQKVMKAEENTLAAEEQLSALNAWLDKKIDGAQDADEVIRQFEKAYNKGKITINGQTVELDMLRKMDKSLGKDGKPGTGDLLAMTRGVDYKFSEMEQQIRDRFAEKEPKQNGSELAQTASKGCGHMVSPVYLPSSQGEAWAKEQEKKLNRAKSVVEDVATPPEQAVMNNAWSVMGETVKKTWDGIKALGLQVGSDLTQQMISNSISRTSSALLKGQDLIADYEKQDEQIAGMVDRENQLKDELGDLVYYGQEPKDFDTATIDVGGNQIEVTMRYDEQQQQFVVQGMKNLTTDSEDLSGLDSKLLHEQRDKELAAANDRQAKIIDANSRAITEEEQQKLDEYNRLVIDTEDAVASQRKNEEAYQTAVKNMQDAQWVRNATVNLLQMAGASEEQLKVFEDTNTVIEGLKNFTKYDPTQWESYNPYNLYAEAMNSDLDGDYSEVLAVAKEGDLETAQEKELAQWILDYSDRMGIEIPDNVRENINRYIAKLDNDHQDYEYFAMLGNDDFKSGAAKGRELLDAGDFDWDNYKETGSIETQPLWDMLTDEQKQKLLEMQQTYDINDVASQYQTYTNKMDIGNRLFGDMPPMFLKNLLTDYEEETYYYLLGTEGAGAAEEYYKHLSDNYGVLNSRYMDVIEAKAEDIAGSGFWGRRAADVLSVIAAPAAAFGSIMYAVEQGIQKLNGQETEFNPNNPWLGLNKFRTTSRAKIQEGIQEDYKDKPLIRDIASSLSEMVSNRLDSAMNFLAFGWLTGGIGNEMLQEFLGAIPMAANAAMDAMAEAKEKGASDTQIWAIGGVTLFAESITEAVSIDNISKAFKIGQDVSAETVRGFIKNWLTKAGISEAVGESINDLLENFADEKIMGELSNHAELVAKYKEENPDMTDEEAEALARRDELSGVLHTALISYLSPGLDVASFGAGRFNYYRSQTRKLQQSGYNVSLIDVMKADKGLRNQMETGKASTEQAPNRTPVSKEGTRSLTQAEIAENQRNNAYAEKMQGDLESGRAAAEQRQNLQPVHTEGERVQTQSEIAEDQRNSAYAEKMQGDLKRGESAKRVSEAQPVAPDEVRNEAGQVVSPAEIQNEPAPVQGRIEVENMPESTPVELEITPEQKAAQDLTMDYEILETAKSADTSSQTASVASVLDFAGTEESADIARAVAANADSILGGEMSTAEWIQDLILGASEGNVDGQVLKQAIQNAVLGGENSAAYQIMQTSEYIHADLDVKAQMLASTVEADTANPQVQEAITQAVHDNRVAEVERELILNGGLDSVMQAQDKADEAAAATVDAQDQLENRQQETEAAKEQLEVTTEEFQNDPGNDDKLKEMQAAQTELNQRDTVEQEYEQHLDKAISDQEAAEQEAKRQKDQAMAEVRQQAEAIVEDQNAKRRERAMQAAEQQRIENENARIAEEQAEQQRIEQEEAESADYADMEAFVEQYANDNPGTTEEDKEHIRERFKGIQARRQARLAEQANQQAAAQANQQGAVQTNQETVAPVNQQGVVQTSQQGAVANQQTPMQGVVPNAETQQENDAPHLTENQRKTLERISDLIGMPIKFASKEKDKNLRHSNGYYDEKNHRIVLNNGLSVEEAMYKILPHELMHIAEMSGTYKQLANTLLKLKYGEGADYQKTIDSLRNSNGRAVTRLEQDINRVKANYDSTLNEVHDYEYIMQERVADMMGELIYNPKNPEKSQELINRLVKEDPSTARRILESIKSFIKKAVGMKGAWLSYSQQTVDMLEAALKDAQGKTSQVERKYIPDYNIRKSNYSDNLTVRFAKYPGEDINHALRKIGMVPYKDSAGWGWRFDRGVKLTREQIENAIRYEPQGQKYSLDKKSVQKPVNSEEKLQLLKDIRDSKISYEKGAYRLETIPPIYTQLFDVGDLDLTIAPRHSYNIMVTAEEAKAEGKYRKGYSDHYHGLGPDGYMEAIDALDNPSVIMDARSNGKKANPRIAMVIDTKTNGQLLAVIDFYSDQRVVDDDGRRTHALLTIYGKDGIEEYVNKANDTGKILYINDKQGHSGATVQFGSDQSSPAVDNNLIQFNEYVKRWKENRDIRYSLPTEENQNSLVDDDEGNSLATELPGGTVAVNTMPGTETIDEQTGEVRYSLNSFTKEEQERVRQALLNKKDANGKNEFTKKQVDKYLEDAMSIASMIASDRQRLDFEASDNQVFLKPNNDYHFTLDASTLCAKRLLYQGTFDYVQHAMPDEVFTPEDLIDLVNIMNEMGYETPCGICYVESRRRWLDTYANEFLEKVQKNEDDYVEKFIKNKFKKASEEEKAALRKRLAEELPSVDDLTTSDGLENLRRNDPVIYKAFVTAMNAKGSQNPKVVQLRTEYRGDIGKLTKNDIQKVKDIGGLRIQSFSDFETPHLLDMIQAVLDMSSAGLTSQAYTKVPNFAWVFGDTGIKINLSLIGKGTGLDENGNLVFDNREGIDFDEAMKLRERYNKNVGTILVGINDNHIIAAMGDPRIDFIIPFHKSGWSAEELRKMPTLNNYNDYTNSQNEVLIVGDRKHRVKELKDMGTKALNNWIVKEGDEHPGYKVIEQGNGKYTVTYDDGYETESFAKHKERTGESFSNYEPVGANQYWDFSKSGEWNANKYLKMCAESGRIPKFSQFLVDNGDGSFSLPSGSDKRSTAIREGYWKTLIDFKMYENDGYGRTKEDGTKTKVKGSKQKEVVPNINMNEAYRVMNEYQLGRQMPDKENGTKGAFIPMKSNNDVPVAVPAAEKYIQLIKERREGKKPVNPDDTLKASPSIDVGSLGESWFGKGPSEEANLNAATAFGATEAPAVMGNEGNEYVEPAEEQRTMAVDEEGNTIRHSLPSDAPYLSAVDHGDMEEAQRMVDEKAQEAGYDVEYAVWRGDYEPYNELEPGVNGGNLGTGLYFTPNRNYAERFASRNSPVRKFYLKKGNTFDYDAFTQEFNNYALNWLAESDTEYDGSSINVDDATWSMIWDDFISENDYDSVKATGVGGLSYGASEIAVQNSWQAKLADPVTYDDNGNVIPLSERFNDRENDIRYSLPSDDILDQLIDEYLSNGGSLSRRTNIPENGNLPGNPGMMPQRQFGNRTAQTSNALHDDVKEYLYNHSSYTPDSNQAQIDRSVDWVRSHANNADPDGFFGALQESRNGNFDMISADGQARMLTLMSMAALKGEQTGDHSAELLLADLYNKQGTEAGRALQARKIFRLMTPVGRVAMLRQMTDQINEQYGKKGISRRVALSEETLQAAANAETEEDFQKVRKDAAKELASQMPANWKEKLQAWRMLAMLGNPRTHIRNVVGNAIFMPAVGLKNKIGAGLESAFIKNGERTKTLGLASQEARAFAKDDAAEMDSVLRGESKYNEGTAVQRERKMFGQGKGVISKTLGRGIQALSDLSGNALELEDWVFLKRHYQNALAGYMTANNLTAEDMTGDTLDKARAYAVNEAQKATYRDANEVATWLNNLKNPVGRFIVNAMLPFKKTPANILKRGIEYSPVSLIRSLTTDAKHLKQWNAYQRGELSVLPDKAISPNQFIDKLASGLSGTAIAALGALLSHLGVVKVGLDDDDDEFDKLQGSQEYSIELFGHSYTIDWAAPVCMPFFVGATIMEEIENDKGEGVNVGDVLESILNIAEPVFNLSMLDGVNSTLTTSQYGEGNNITQIGEKIIANYATSFIPTFFSQVAKSVDTTRRKNYVESGASLPVFRSALEQVENKIPFLSRTNIPYRDVWGNADTSPQEWAIIENFISPGYGNELKNDPVTNELKRIYEETGDKNLIPKVASKSISIAGETVKLNAEQYDQYVVDRGQLAYKSIESLMESPVWQICDDDTRAMMIADAWTYSNQIARHNLDSNGKKDSWVANAEYNGNFVDTVIDRAADTNRSDYIKGYGQTMAEAIDSEDTEMYELSLAAIESADAKESEIRSSLRDYFKPKYQQAFEEGDEDTMEEIEDKLLDVEVGFKKDDFSSWIPSDEKDEKDEEKENRNRWLKKR